MAILWLDVSSGLSLDAIENRYEINNPKAGENTHLIDHTWLALVATAGLPIGEYTFLRQAEGWRATVNSGGVYVNETLDFSQFENILSGYVSSDARTTVIVQVEHTPERMTSAEYAEGEYVFLLMTAPIHDSLKSLHSDLSSFKDKVSTLESTVSDLTSRLEALESTNPE